MKLIIDMIVEFKEYIIIALSAVLGGFAYFFIVYFAKKYIVQLKNMRYLHASLVLIVINVFYVIICLQRFNTGLGEFAKAFAYLLLSLCATIIYMVLAVAVTANQRETFKIKRVKSTK